MKLSKMELKLLIWEWNELIRNMYLKGTNRHGPDYREIQTDAEDIVEYPMDSVLYIKEYLPCGGSRAASIYFLDSGITINTEHTYNMDYAKQWGFDGIIPSEKALEYIVDIDTLNPEDYHIGSCKEYLKEK